MKPHPLPALILPRSTLLLVAIIVVIMQQLRVALCNEETDHMALLAIKSQLINQDPEGGVLRSWNHSHHHCSWDGVICGRKHKRVTELRLHSRGLVGTISPFMGNLSFLRYIRFYNNSLHGQIPSEIGRLSRLQLLYLHNNSLFGEMPANISGCVNLQNLSVGYNNLQGELPSGLGALSNLKYLWVENNHFSGALFNVIANLTSLEAIVGLLNAFTGIIPPEIGRLSKLQILYLDYNSLVGEIPTNISGCINLQEFSIKSNNLQGKLPTGLGALSNLKFLSVHQNHFSEPVLKAIANLTSLETLDLGFNTFTGTIPDTISRMTKLLFLSLASNHKLTGMIPPSVFNLSSLEILDLGTNQLQGRIPQDIAFTLPQLQELYVPENYLSGPLPISLANLTSLVIIELGTNNFTGNIPAYLGRLHNLKLLSLYKNSFVGDLSFINSLVNCSQLETLQLGQNYFRGTLPQYIANLSTNLNVLNIEENPISNGGIPLGISNLNNLRILWLGSLGLTGTIPLELGKLQKLEVLYLESNKLIGEIPISMGNLSRLSRLQLNDNQLQGKIAPSLGKCGNLLSLNLSYNRFSGSLPNELFAKTNFFELDLGFNHLEGFLPVEIGKQINLKTFVVSKNKFIGEIPSVFSSLPELQELYMDDNFFHGPIPPSFIPLKSLSVLDLSLNNLSGPVPEYFSSFPLIYLNLSYNNFEGKVPTKGVFLNATAISLVGNSRLCGGMSALHLPICVEKDRRKRRMACALKLTIIVICAFVGVLVLLTCIWLYFTSLTKTRKSVSSDALLKESHLKVSYNMLLKATEGFCSRNLLGYGSFGSVFKATIDGKTVAVKVLNLQHRGGSKSFMAECEALRNIRHRNLVGILTVCSGTDFLRNDFKALIYEFMPNGSLEKWLHGDGNLSLLRRLDIAIDVAYALNYLHHECDNQIVHCDLKPSNILLDHDMVAHVADFGLAKVLGLSQHPYQSSSVGVRGTIGYVAPEYGLGGEVSPEADLYSFGILLLELMTRKRPTNEMFKEDFNLHMYAKGALPDQVLQIVDTTQLIEHENEEDDNRQPRTQTMLQMKEECIVSVVKIGVACSNQSPSDRMNMIAAISELQRAKKILVR